MQMTTNTDATSHLRLPKICTTGWHGGWGHQGHAEQPTPSQHRAH
jgi:hypothetical protein